MTSTEYIKSAVSNMITDIEEVMAGTEIIEIEAAKIQALGILTKVSSVKVELKTVRNHIENLKQYIELEIR